MPQQLLPVPIKPSIHLVKVCLEDVLQIRPFRLVVGEIKAVPTLQELEGCSELQKVEALVN